MRPSLSQRRRRSPRLQAFDYTSHGAYFVTICTHEREHLFGEVVDGRMMANANARNLAAIWGRTVNGGKKPSPYDFVVMPNHVHGLVWLPRKPADNRWAMGASECGDPGVGTQRPRHRKGAPSPTDILHRSHTPFLVDAASLHGDDAATHRWPERGSLGAILRSFKSNAAREINRLRGSRGAPVWQGRYHDTIIRNERHLEKARLYILNNPANWQDDPMNESG